MSSEIITSNDLKKILASAFPARANTTITSITLPYTPPCNGIFFGMLRAAAQGRAYKQYSNVEPSLWDFYQVAGGYSTFASFAKANKQIAETATSNINASDAIYYFFVPLDGTSPLLGGNADAVVEEGTQTCTGPVTWWWRKWESGIVDLWGVSTDSEAPYGSTVLSWYPHTRTLSFPFSIKDAAGTYSVFGGSSWAIPGAAFPYSQDSSSSFISDSRIYALCSQSGTISVTYKIKLTARWK